MTGRTTTDPGATDPTATVRTMTVEGPGDGPTGGGRQPGGCR